MRDVTITVYKFSELDDHAKDVAREWYAQGGYPWAEEVRDSLDAVLSWIDNATVEEIAACQDYGQAATLRFTGYCADADIGDAVIDAAREGEEHDYLRTVAEQAAEAHADRDWEAQLEDEALSETCDANNYEFTKDGRPA